MPPKFDFLFEGFLSVVKFKTKINNKVEIDGWESLLAFDRVIGEVTDKIVKESANKFGCGKYSFLQAKSSKSPKTPKTPKVSDLTKTSKAKKPSKPKKSSDKPKKTEEEIAEAKALRQHDEMVRRNKKDEKLFIRLEKEFETFHNTLLFIEEKCGTQDCPLTLPAVEEKAMRIFHIDEGALNQVFCDNDESGEEEVEEEEEAERNENDASEEENDASEEDKRKTDDSDKSSDSE